MLYTYSVIWDSVPNAFASMFFGSQWPDKGAWKMYWQIQYQQVVLNELSLPTL